MVSEHGRFGLQGARHFEPGNLGELCGLMAGDVPEK
jgi:hypothetical protein